MVVDLFSIVFSMCKGEGVCLLALDFHFMIILFNKRNFSFHFAWGRLCQGNWQ